MSNGLRLRFHPFVLDASNQTLLRGAEKIALRPKSLAVLGYLAKHSHQLVSKDALMAALWPRAKVVDATLRVSIQEIRKALGDSATNPKFIETVGKTGYRFIAPVKPENPAAPEGEANSPFVGREKELAQLEHHFGLAGTGKRQLVFISGEPGIGKTTLVDSFVRALPTSNGVLIARGQCIEQYGSSEAYLPILDTLEQLCKPPDGPDNLVRLHRFAPSWMVSLPTLASVEERTELTRQTLGTTPERRMREIATFFEEFQRPDPSCSFSKISTGLIPLRSR